MKLKNTLLLILLAGGLLAFIKFYESKQLSSREAKERAGKVAVFDRDKVNAITIKNSESKIALRKDDKGSWQLEEPVKDRADSMVVSQLFTAAESLPYDAVIGDESKAADKEQLKEFGLFNSETKLKFAGAEKTVELVFGKDAAVEGKVYVKLDEGNAAYVIGKDLKEQISRKVDDFRDHKLTDLNTAQVNKVSIKTKAGEIELEKKDQHWAVLKPLRARADDSKIGDIVSQVAAARIESFVGDAAVAATYGLQEPRVTVALSTDGGGEPVVLQVGGNPADDKEKTAAKVSTRVGAVLLPKSIETLIDLKPNDLRDRRLVRVEADIIDRINIQAAGADKVVLARSGESWVRKVGGKDEAINVAAAKRLLDEVRGQEVATFVSDVATELPKYGLDQPRVTLTLSSYASENTAETKSGEKPIVAITFGKEENGNVYARVEDEPFIVAVPVGLLEVLMTDPLQWQPLEIYNHKAEDLVSLEVTRHGQPPIALVREKEKPWKLAKGDGAVNQINVQSLVNTLSRLRAVRWLGVTQPEFGLEQPTLTVTFKTVGDGAGKMVVGTTSAEGINHASADALKGAFDLSKPDLSAFQLPLLEKVPTAPVPSASPPAPGAPPLPAPATPAPLVPPPQ